MLNAMVSKFVSRLRPKIAKRPLPAYVACVLVILSLWSLGTHSHTREVSTGPISDIGGVMKRDLALHAKNKPENEFPRKIWQAWKVDPLGFDERDLTCARTWTQKNPGHRYEVLTDSNDLHYVETHFGPLGLNRPDIVYTYRELKAKIIKADLIRYLVMYIEGGIYADIDVEALRPIERFIPDRYDTKDIGMVIGVEIDQPEFEDHPILGPKSKSFCQWTFMCKPGLPVMMRLIDGIVKWLSDVAKEQKVPLSEIELDFDQVISGTGPSAFTEAVLAEMSKKAGRTIVWDEFHAMRESVLVGGVLVLTVEAFAAGQGHSDSGNHNARTALVKHRYHASSWPSQHHRYKHPVFGEVEKCNWDAECVKIWDYSKAAFEALSPAEQAQKIKEKEAEDIAAAEKEEVLKKLGELEKENEKKRKAEEAAALERLGQHEREQAFLNGGQGAPQLGAAGGALPGGSGDFPPGDPAGAGLNDLDGDAKKAEANRLLAEAKAQGGGQIPPQNILGGALPEAKPAPDLFGAAR